MAPADGSSFSAGTIVAAVLAAAAVAAAGWPSIVAYGTAAIEWISVTLHDLPENEVSMQQQPTCHHRQHNQHAITDTWH